MKTGLFAGISNAAYHAGDGISKSGLDLIARSPLHYFAKYRSPDRERDEPTEAMKLGTAVHSAVLEPESFASDYIVVPADAPRRPTTVQLNAKKPSDDTVIAIEWFSELPMRQ